MPTDSFVVMLQFVTGPGEFFGHSGDELPIVGVWSHMYDIVRFSFVGVKWCRYDRIILHVVFCLIVLRASLFEAGWGVIVDGVWPYVLLHAVVGDLYVGAFYLTVVGTANCGLRRASFL